MNQRIGKIARRGRTRLTNQQLADLALQADQQRRAALKSGDKSTAKIHNAEVRRLVRLVK